MAERDKKLLSSTVGRAGGRVRRSLTGLLHQPGPRPATGHVATEQGASAGPVSTGCHAPFSTLYFDTLGAVRPCCRNVTHPLGHIGSASIREIWDGATTAALRAALRDDDYSLGCEWCSVHANEGDDEHVYARLFDQYAPSPPSPTWPRRMEFSLSNTCNLQCEMCNGELSSAIRRQRERLAPLPHHYGDAFFAELAEFVPHLESAGFAGGEPFLAREAHRVFDLLIDRAPHVRCNVATNGTIWNERVERILDELTVDIAVSMDGGSAEVFEAIRTGASFDEVVANLDRFVEHARRRGTTVEIHHCLMPQNVDSFHEILRLAEDRDIRVAVNAVRDPKEFSLDYLGAAELAAAARSLADQVEQWADALPRNGAALRQEADRMARRLRRAADGEQFPELFEQPVTEQADLPELMFLGLPVVGDGSADIDEGRRRLLESWPEEPYHLVISPEEVLVEVDDRTAARLGTSADALIGQPGTAVLPLVVSQFGDPLGESTVHADCDVVEREVAYERGRVRAVLGVERGTDGRVTRGVVWFTDLLEPAASGVELEQ